MNNLPISINATPVKAAVAKQATSSDSAKADSAEFGNVLARQVNDTDKEAAPPAEQQSKDTNKKTGDQDNTKPRQQSDEASTVPAEMLATLVAQQNTPFPIEEVTDKQTESVNQPEDSQPAAAKQPDLIQPFAITPFAAPISGAANQNERPIPTTPGVKQASTGIQQPELETALPKFSAGITDEKGFADPAKALGKKELGPTNPAQTSRTTGITELPITAQHATVPPILQGTSSTSGPVTIHSAINQPAWGEEFSQKITWLAGQRNQSAELHLNPPQLGPLDVVLKMNGDQASAIFTSPHAAVRDAIEQALPQLREMLADSGIMLGNATVNDQAANKNPDNPSRKSAPTKSETDSGISTQASVLTSVKSRHNGMVDTFA